MDLESKRGSPQGATAGVGDFVGVNNLLPEKAQCLSHTEYPVVGVLGESGGAWDGPGGVDRSCPTEQWGESVWVVRSRELFPTERL